MTQNLALFVVTDANVGGSTMVTVRFAAALHSVPSPSWRLEVLTPPEGRVADLFRQEGVRVHPLRLSPAAQARLRAGRHRNALDALASTAFQTAVLARRLRPDVIQVSDEASLIPAAAAARLTGTRLLWYVHNFRGHRFDPLVVRLPHHLALLTPRMRKRFERVRRKPEASIVPYAIDVTRFRPAPDKAAARTALGLPAQRPLIGYVGNLQARKRPEWAVRIAAELAEGSDTDPLVLMAGGDMDDGSYRKRLLDEAQATGAPVRLLGPRDDIDALMPTFDVLILPSDVDGEVLPLVMGEAAACRVPVVATDVGAVTDLIEDQVTGLVVAHDDFPGFRRAVARMLSEPDTTARLVEAAYQRVRSRHAPERHIAAMLDAYDATALRLPPAPATA